MAVEWQLVNVPVLLFPNLFLARNPSNEQMKQTINTGFHKQLDIACSYHTALRSIFTVLYYTLLRCRASHYQCS